MPKETHYDVLGVGWDATGADVKKAYRALAKQWHPDKSANGNDRERRERFLKIQLAYDTLSDPTKRAGYRLDLMARGQTPGERPKGGGPDGQPRHSAPKAEPQDFALRETLRCYMPGLTQEETATIIGLSRTAGNPDFFSELLDYRLRGKGTDPTSGRIDWKDLRRRDRLAEQLDDGEVARLRSAYGVGRGWALWSTNRGADHKNPAEIDRAVLWVVLGAALAHVVMRIPLPDNAAAYASHNSIYQWAHDTMSAMGPGAIILSVIVPATAVAVVMMPALWSHASLTHRVYVGLRGASGGFQLWNTRLREIRAGAFFAGLAAIATWPYALVRFDAWAATAVGVGLLAALVALALRKPLNRLLRHVWNPITLCRIILAEHGRSARFQFEVWRTKRRTRSRRDS